MHMGQLDHADIRKLIEAHENIHFNTAHSTSIKASPIAVVKESEDPRTKMFEGDRLSAEWKRLMMKHPDRDLFWDSIMSGLSTGVSIILIRSSFGGRQSRNCRQKLPTPLHMATQNACGACHR
jgi:hypothetical protein